MKKGYDFETKLVSFFRSQGYLAKRGIPLVMEDNQDSTDIDVYGIKFTYPFIEMNCVCDCKNKVRPKPFERLFWTRGMADYVRVDNVYVALPKIQTNIAKFASSMGVNILTEDKVNKLTKTCYEYSIHEDKLSEDKELRNYYRKIKKFYILKNPYVLINICMSGMDDILSMKNDSNEEVINVILGEIIVLSTVALLRICSKLMSLDEINQEKEIISRLTYGEVPPEKANNILEGVSRIALEVIKNETGTMKYQLEEFNFIEAPSYANDIVGIVKRIMEKPEYYIQLPQMMDYIINDIILSKEKFSEEKFKDLFGSTLVQEKIKACKNIFHFFNSNIKYKFYVDEIFK